MAGMDVTTASLKAIAAQTVDPEWTPEIGELFVRFHVSPTKMEVEFCVAEKVTATGTWCFSVARIYEWRGQATCSSFLDCIKGESGTTFTGAAIVRRYVTDSDLEALEKLWGERGMPFAVWLRGVLSNMAISESSRDFIRETLVSRQGRTVSDG